MLRFLCFSGGSANAAATCAGVDPLHQYNMLKGMADYCRPSGGCRGFLDTVVTKQLHTIQPPEAPKLCSGRLYAAVTVATPDGKPDPHMLLGGDWTDTEQLVSAVAASCYLPSLSGPTATTRLHWKPDAGAVYDGGFSHRLPCPPGVLLYRQVLYYFGFTQCLAAGSTPSAKQLVSAVAGPCHVISTLGPAASAQLQCTTPSNPFCSAAVQALCLRLCAPCTSPLRVTINLMACLQSCCWL